MQLNFACRSPTLAILATQSDLAIWSFKVIRIYDVCGAIQPTKKTTLKILGLLLSRNVAHMSATETFEFLGACEIHMVLPSDVVCCAWYTTIKVLG